MQIREAENNLAIVINSIKNGHLAPDYLSVILKLLSEYAAGIAIFLSEYELGIENQIRELLVEILAGFPSHPQALIEFTEEELGSELPSSLAIKLDMILMAHQAGHLVAFEEDPTSEVPDTHLGIEVIEV